MRIANMLVVGLLTLSVTVCAQQEPPPPDPNELLTPQEVLLTEAIIDGRAVPPEQAVASVREFLGNPNLEIVIHGFVDTPTSHFQERTYYNLRIDEGPDAGMYQVRGDGAVYAAMRKSDAGDEQPPVITMEGARTLAMQFAREHYPNFDQRQWFVPRGSPELDESQYYFSWKEVLNAHGTLARWPLTIHVDGVTGKVTTYFRPTDRVTGPTVPQVSRAQAEQIASAMAPFDPALVPFDEVVLELLENEYGAQNLDWYLSQPDPENPGGRFDIMVDALTGETSAARGPLGSVPPAKRKRSPKAKKLTTIKRPAPITLRAANGPIIRAGSSELREERLWIRVELLRGFGARLVAEPQRLLVRAGKKRVEGPALGGEFRPRDNGWWIPLRQACDELGWQVTWDAAKREAVVNMAAAGR